MTNNARPLAAPAGPLASPYRRPMRDLYTGYPQEPRIMLC